MPTRPVIFNIGPAVKHRMRGVMDTAAWRLDGGRRGHVKQCYTSAAPR